MITLALFIGVIGTLIALRALGTRWPWELAAAPVAARMSSRVGDSRFYRMPLRIAGRVIAGMRREGWTPTWEHCTDGQIYLVFERRAT